MENTVFKIEQNEIVKYDVTLDLEQIKKIKEKIIDNCSEVKHIKTWDTNPRKTENMRNYSAEALGTVDYFDALPGRNYKITYDYYTYHELVNYVDSLLNGNIDAIKKMELMSNDTSELIALKEKRKKLLEQLCKEDLDNEIMRKLNENQEEIEKYEQKEMRDILAIKYRDKVLNCINYNEIARMPLETVLEVEQFLNHNDLKTTIEHDKVLKLKR